MFNSLFFLLLYSPLPFTLLFRQHHSILLPSQPASLPSTSSLQSQVDPHKVHCKPTRDPHVFFILILLLNHNITCSCDANIHKETVLCVETTTHTLTYQYVHTDTHVHTHTSNGLSCNYSHLSNAHLDLWLN